MDATQNLRVVFTEKADLIFSDILKNNNIQENNEDFFDESNQERELPADIVRSTIIAMAKKMAPDEKLTELLQKHLGITADSAQKILNDIKIKLLPLLIIAPDEKFNDPVFREEISKKVFGDTTLSEGQKSELPQDEKKEAFRKAKEELLRKIGAVKKDEPAAILPKQDSSVMRPSITDVEENAKKIEGTRKPMVSENKELERPKPAQETKSDPYKESIK